MTRKPARHEVVLTEDAVLVGVESRTSSPVRVPRTRRCRSRAIGLNSDGPICAPTSGWRSSARASCTACSAGTEISKPSSPV